MKWMIAALMVLTSAAAVNAGSGKNPNYDGPTVNFRFHNLDVVDIRELDCDRLLTFAKAKGVFQAKKPGIIVAGDSLDCNVIQTFDYDFFRPTGAFVRVRDGRCNVWSCDGIIRSGGD
ncbi:MAG: hypothetical protein AAGE89_09050 [Pseudomonadota bacterium]